MASNSALRSLLAVVAMGSLLLGTDGWRALSIFQRIAVFSPLAVCAGLLALSLVRLMAPGGKHVISPTRLSIGFLPLALIIATVFHSRQESGFVAAGLICLRTGLSCAVPAAALFWLLLRRGAILYPGLTGAVAGGLAGLVGLMVLEVRCPNLSGYHILVWHWGVAFLALLDAATVTKALPITEHGFSKRQCTATAFLTFVNPLASRNFPALLPVSMGKRNVIALNTK
jgi:hypothetical protein